MTAVAGGRGPDTPLLVNTGDGSNGTQEDRHDTTSDVAMSDGKRAAVSNPSVKSGGTSKQYRPVTEEEEVPAPVDA